MKSSGARRKLRGQHRGDRIHRPPAPRHQLPRRRAVQRHRGEDLLRPRPRPGQPPRSGPACTRRSTISTWSTSPSKSYSNIPSAPSSTTWPMPPSKSSAEGDRAIRQGSRSPSQRHRAVHVRQPAPDTFKVVKNPRPIRAGPAQGPQPTIIRNMPESGSRLAMLQTGEAQFIFQLPVEMPRHRTQPDAGRDLRRVDLRPLPRAQQHGEAVHRRARARGAELRGRQAGLREGGLQRLRRADDTSLPANLSGYVNQGAPGP